MAERDCERAREQLALGEPEGRSELARHLATCEACRSEADGLERLVDLLAASAEVHPDAGLDRSVREMLTGENGGARWALRPFLAMGLALGSLIALVSALGGTIIENGLDDGNFSLAIAATVLYLGFSFAATLPLLVILRARMSRMSEEVRP